MTRRSRSKSPAESAGATRAPAESAKSLLLPPWALALALGVLTMSACLALGGVFALATGALSVGAGLLVVVAPSPRAPRKVARRLLWLGLALSVYTTLTLIPLPAALLRTIADAQAEVWRGALVGEQAPRWASLSLDPAATWVELTKLALYGCVFVVALTLAERRPGVIAVERVVCAVTSLVALISLGHFALEMTQVFGVYQPEIPRLARHTTVLLNANHLAEVMVIGAAVGTGILASEPSRQRKLEGALTLALCTVGVALAASRGGLVAFAFACGIALFGARVQGSSRARVTLGLALGIGSLAIFAVAWSDTIASEALSYDLEKIDIFRESLPLLFRYGLLGIGRGAFEAVSPEARRAVGAFVYTHPENLLLQWSIEWGALTCVGIVVVLWRTLTPSVLRGRARMPWGAYGATLGFLLQNMVDFGSEMPGVVMLAVCCVALVVGGSTDPRQRHSHERAPTAIGVRIRALRPWLLGAIALALGARTLVHADDELWVEVRSLTKELAANRPDFPARLRTAILHHPAEPHLAYLGALHATQNRQSALGWAARAIERSPIHGRAHLLIARELESRAPAQARFEYRLAYVQDGVTGAAYVDAARRLVHDYDSATQMLPRAVEPVSDGSQAGARTLHVPAAQRIHATLALTSALQHTLPATAHRLLQGALDETSSDARVPVLAALATAATHDVFEGEPWCAYEPCREEAERWVTQWVQDAPKSAAAQIAVVELLAARSPAAALERVAQVERLVDEPQTLWFAASEIAFRARMRAEAAELLTRATERCGLPERCVPALTTAIEVQRRRGRPEQALVLLRRKSELLPLDVPTLREHAELAESLGLLTEAGDVFSELHRLEPNQPEWSEAQRRVRQRQLSRTLPTRILGDAGALLPPR